MAPVAQATDINAPIDKRPTVGSEINRGNKAAFDCGLRHVSDVLAFSKCVSDVISMEEQNQQNYLPFMVGAYWGECENEALSVESNSKIASTNNFAAAELPDDLRELASTYRVFRNYQKKLGVTDDQLVAALDDLTPEGKKMLLAQLHSWENAPPQAHP